MPEPPRQPRFRTTRWSLVRVAQGRGADEGQRRDALGELCERYWYPLFAFARRSGCGEHDAADLVQGLLARLLEEGAIDAAAPERGRFRSYLLGALRHHMANADRFERAARRGSGRVLALDVALAGEEAYALEPTHAITAEALFERSYALAVLETAVSRVRSDYEGRGKSTLFERLRGFLDGDREAHSQVAADLGITEGACKVAVHRLRQRFASALRDEVAQTVSRPDDVDDELAALRRALRPG